MNITRENVDELNATLKVEVAKEDYFAKVDKQLKELQRKMSLPGFRPGHVPQGMVKKMYGKSVVLEEVNKTAYDSIEKYLKENNIEILGSPLPNVEKTKPIDLENESDYEFYFDLGIKPKVNIDFSKIEVQQYKIIIDENVISKQIERYSKTYSERTNPEISESNDVLSGEFVELNEEGSIKENGIKNITSVAINKINGESRNKFIGIKKGDIVKVKPSEAFENTTDLAYMLKIKKEEVENLKSDFQFTVNEIIRFVPAEVNQDLFNKVFGEGIVNTDEEFKTKVTEKLEESFEVDTAQKFMHDTIDELIEKTDLILPDVFLKRYIMESNEKVTQDIIEKEYEKYSRSLKWQIIESYIAKENNIEIKKEEIEDYIKKYIEKQWSYIKKEATPEETAKVVQSVMSDKKQVEKIYEELFDGKLKVFFKEKVKSEIKEISYDDYIKLLTEHLH
ncbi:MAG: trigger factor [Bacteroidales bacterium]|jgi:trigger factor